MALRWLSVFLYPKKEEGDEHVVKINKVYVGGLTSSSSSSCHGAANKGGSEFQMPLHYPRYTKMDYEKMEEWRLDLLLKQYGLNAVSNGNLEEKRAYAIGAFLWPDQY